MAQKYYAVKQGRETGIFTSWDACKAQVHGCPGAIYKSFPSLQEAEQYLHGTLQAVVDGSAGERGSVEAVVMDLQNLPDGEMVAYVDGSFLLEQRKYAFGAVIFYAGKEYRFSGSDNDAELADMRNVAGEIMGAQRAIEFALEQNARMLHIYHDYEGIARWCTGEWQAKKAGTQAYRDGYRQAVGSGLQIQFHKVKGHSGDTYNEIADRLAKSALGIK